MCCCFRAHVSAAPLKRHQNRAVWRQPTAFPRSRERGPIEAYILCHANLEGHEVLAGLSRFKTDALRLSPAVVIPQMSIDFHCEGASVLMSEPSGHSRDIDPRFDASGGEEVPKVVMGNTVYLRKIRGAVQGLLAFMHEKDPSLRRFLRSFQ